MGNQKSGHIRTLRILGLLPDYVDITKTYWDPIRDRAKKLKKETRWVSMYPVRTTDEATGAVCTELCFITDGRCKKGYEEDALDDAVDQIREGLRLIASDINVALMASARLVEEVSVDFVDELNKFASKDTTKNSPILRQILDVAERGRSLGIILFGAEQFRSNIHPRVTGNCSTLAFGRTNVLETTTKDYSALPTTYKNILTRLEQGEYVIQNPIFRSLLKIQFPKPIYKQC